MSTFASPDNYQTPQSTLHQKSLLAYPFVLKKAKEVYLYDIDAHKYTDFFLDNGTILQHSPPRLTKFIKNALSYGLNVGGLYSKFLYKAQKNWKEIFSCDDVSFFSSFLDMVLSVLSTKDVKDISYTSEYLHTLLTPLEGLIPLKKIEEHGDMIIFADNTKIKIHSRFLFREDIDFDSSCLHYVGNVVFGGKTIGVLSGKFSYNPPPFDESILFLEGAKLFNSQKIKFTKFSHPRFQSHNGYAICEDSLDEEFFVRRGVYVRGDTLYFSPLHSKHDFKRLYRALDEYYDSKVNR